MIFDDFRSALGYEPVDSEILYEEIIHKRTTRNWSGLWNDIQGDWSIGPFWCVKVMYHYTPYISRFIAGKPILKTPPVRDFRAVDFDDFHAFFKEAIWVKIQRQDVYAQAISMYFAETTGIWESRDPAMVPDVATPAYDQAKLLTYLGDFIRERQQWELFFSHYNISPLVINYEDAISHYPEYLDPLLERTGLSALQPLPPRRLFKLGNDVNANFAERLRADALRIFGSN